MHVVEKEEERSSRACALESIDKAYALEEEEAQEEAAAKTTELADKNAARRRGIQREARTSPTRAPSPPSHLRCAPLSGQAQQHPLSQAPVRRTGTTARPSPKGTPASPSPRGAPLSGQVPVRRAGTAAHASPRSTPSSVAAQLREFKQSRSFSPISRSPAPHVLESQSTGYIGSAFGQVRGKPVRSTTQGREGTGRISSPVRPASQGAGSIGSPDRLTSRSTESIGLPVRRDSLPRSQLPSPYAN